MAQSAEQAETQEDTVPRWCGGPQVTCLAHFAPAAPAPVPAAGGRGKPGPKKGSTRKPKDNAGAAGGGVEGSGGNGNDDTAPSGGGRGRAANAYWKEEVDGVCLLLVLKDDRIRDSFINKDLHQSYTQLDSKVTDQQAMWSDAFELFNDLTFKPSNPFPGDDWLNDVKPEQPSGYFDVTALQKHLGQIQRRLDRSDTFWHRTGNGEPGVYHNYCYINPQTEAELLACEDGKAAMPLKKGCAGRKPKFLPDIYILHRWESSGGDIGPFVAGFTNQVPENLREESGVGSADQGKDSAWSGSLGQSFDSYRLDLSSGSSKQDRMDERNTNAMQKAMGKMGFQDQEEAASVAVVQVKEHTMKAAKVEEDLCANAESERYEMILIETIQKLEDQMDPSHAKFREDPTGMWGRYLTKKRQQLLAHMGEGEPPPAHSPKRLTPRS